MPLWHIYHPSSTFTDQATKASLARAITATYTNRGFPAFYVNVFFHPMRGEDLFIGGTPQSLAPGESETQAILPRPFIRLVGEHIAWAYPEDMRHRMELFCQGFEKTIKPYIADMGYDWEFHVDETPTGLWHVGGLRAPPNGSDALKMWVEENRAVPWEGKGFDGAGTKI